MQANIFSINPDRKIVFGKRKTKTNKLIAPTNTNLKDGIGKENLELIEKLYDAAASKNRDLFLFGGSARDCLLGREINDLDFIINGDAIEFAKELKRDNENVFTKIFLKPKVKRAVVYTDSMGIDIKPLSEDCCVISGKDAIRQALIKNALKDDFKINTMIIKITRDAYGVLKLKLLDFFGAKKDLKSGNLQHISKENFQDNPILALRGIRFKYQYDMKVNPETQNLIKETLKNPKTKKNSYYYRYFREYFKIAQKFLSGIFR